MGGLSRWAVRKPWWALLAFIVMAGVIGFLGSARGGELKDSFELPDTESLQADRRTLDELTDSLARFADEVDALHPTESQAAHRAQQ